MSENTVVTCNQAAFKFEIKDFFSVPYNTNKCFDSKNFLLSDAEYRVSIYCHSSNIPRNVVLYLFKRGNSDKQYHVATTFGIKRADGSVYSIKRRVGYVWSGETIGFIDRRELLNFKDTLVPGGTLTILFTFRLMDAAPKTCDIASQTSTNGIERLAQNLEDLLLSERGANVTIKVQDHEFRAHRSILVARSTVFDSMFKHDMVEKTSGTLEIQDCDPVSFKDFLLYLYTGELEYVTSANACSLFKTADKYNVDELKAKCLKCMADRLSVDSFFDVILVATMYDKSNLLKVATDFFLKNAKSIVRSGNWKVFLINHFDLGNEMLTELADSYASLEEETYRKL